MSESINLPPVALTLNAELNARETTCRAHLWFVNPQNTSWTPLYTADQLRAAIKATRALALEEAAKACEPSNINDPADWTDYAKAMVRCAEKVRALIGKEPTT